MAKKIQITLSDEEDEIIKTIQKSHEYFISKENVIRMIISKVNLRIRDR